MGEQHHAGNRREDLRLVTGCGKYAADFNLPRQLYAYFLRSDRAHAEIVSIDAGPALRRSGVRAVLTGADALVAGYTRFLNFVSTPGRNEQPILLPERPVLAAKFVRHVGDAVALVIADSGAAAQDAAEAIEIEYRDLPVVIDPEDAIAPGAVQLHDTIPGNLCFDCEAGDEGAVREAFNKAAHITRLKVRTSRVLPNPMEPRACLVSFEPADESYDLYCPAQGMNTLRKLIAFTTGVPEDRLRIHIQDVGGSFGQRSLLYPEHCALMVAAKTVGRPVKWVSTRSEGFVSDTHGRAMVIEGELALDRDARFVGARFNFICDMGAYLSANGAAAHTRHPTGLMSGVYRIPALYGRFRLALTNTTPVAPYRGAGRPDMAYALERLVDQAAGELGIDRVELRQRNYIPLSLFPYKSPTGWTYEACDFAAVLRKALAIADWNGHAARRERSTKAGKLRGIGLASIIEHTGAGFFPKDQIALEFDASGAITVYSVKQSGGQGHETTFAMIVADTLGVPTERVTLRESPVGTSLVGNHTGGSRSTVALGSLCKLAALKVIEQGKALAAMEFAVEPSQVDFADGGFKARDSGTIVGLIDLARKRGEQTPHPLSVQVEASFGFTFPNGCHVAEVEIDPDTGTTEIVCYTAVDDSGNVINHAVVEGQVHGAVTQGAGQILHEHGMYDRETGQFYTGSFIDYFMPRAGMIRELRVDGQPLPSKSNVLGAKGVGEAGCTGSIPALANAIMDALRPLGIRHLDMPFTPSKVWHAIRDARQK